MPCPAYSQSAAPSGELPGALKRAKPLRPCASEAPQPPRQNRLHFYSFSISTIAHRQSRHQRELPMSPFSSPCIIGWHRPAAVLPALAPPRAPRPLPCPSLPCSPAPEKRRTPPAPRPCRHLPPPAPLQLTQHLQQLRRRPPGRTAFLSRLAALPAPTALHGKGRGGDVTRRRGRVRQGTAAARSLSAPRRRPAQLLAPSHEPAGGSLKSESEIRVTLAPLGPVTDWSSAYSDCGSDSDGA